MTREPDPGQCRDCMKRREVFSCSRRGGGNYRIAPRRFSSSICAECAVGLLDNATIGHDPMGWDAQDLRAIVASIDTDEARRVTVEWQAKLDERAAATRASDERMKPYWDRVRERDAIRDFVAAKARTEGPHQATYQSIAGDLKRGDAASANKGWSTDADGTSSWPKTIRDQIADHIQDEADQTEYLDVETLRTLASDIRAGKHLPDPIEQAQDKT